MLYAGPPQSDVQGSSPDDLRHRVRHGFLLLVVFTEPPRQHGHLLVITLGDEATSLARDAEERTHDDHHQKYDGDGEVHDVHLFLAARPKFKTTATSTPPSVAFHSVTGYLIWTPSPIREPGTGWYAATGTSAHPKRAVCDSENQGATPPTSIAVSSSARNRSSHRPQTM